MHKWTNDERMMIACCNDGTRPGIFKIERCGGFNMFFNINHRLKKLSALGLVLFTVALVTSCGYKEAVATKESAESQGDTASTGGKPIDDTDSNKQSPAIESTPVNAEETENIENDEMEKLFGENCISGQTFEVELSAYNGKVYFVPYAPYDDGEDFGIEIIKDGEVLTKICTYVPDELADEKFSSIDAVSFYDINYDGNTDIVLIETYGDTSFAAVYYGFGENSYDYEKYFNLQRELSETISNQVETLTIPEIRSFLADGKKNGEFSDYQEAYRAVSKLCGIESLGEEEYNLIYFDDDDIPELVAGAEGYYTSLYTYKDGTVYTLMNRWAYGEMGNAGYEYCPKMNSLRNYNADCAGAIMYTTYMSVGDWKVMDVVARIETLNFDDVNGDGVPDDNESGSIGYYSVSYIDGREVTDEECASYDMGEYEPIAAKMSLEELWSKL